MGLLRKTFWTETAMKLPLARVGDQMGFHIVDFAVDFEAYGTRSFGNIISLKSRRSKFFKF